jgi:hypothetical protein
MEPKKPTKKAAKKATKKAVAPTPPPPKREPVWDVKRAQFDMQNRWRPVIEDGYEPFAIDGGWLYLRKKLG